jgi:hypothetical protein
MDITQICPWCNKEFKSNHRNKSYCSDEHRMEAKKERQKEKRDPIKVFFPIMMKNHEQLKLMFNIGLKEVTGKQLLAYGVDISLCRHIKQDSENGEIHSFDFGEYCLIYDKSYSKYKISKNDSKTALYTR